MSFKPLSEEYSIPASSGWHYNSITNPEARNVYFTAIRIVVDTYEFGQKVRLLLNGVEIFLKNLERNFFHYQPKKNVVWHGKDKLFIGFYNPSANARTLIVEVEYDIKPPIREEEAEKPKEAETTTATAPPSLNHIYAI